MQESITEIILEHRAGDRQEQKLDAMGHISEISLFSCFLFVLALCGVFTLRGARGVIAFRGGFAIFLVVFFFVLDRRLLVLQMTSVTLCSAPTPDIYDGPAGIRRCMTSQHHFHRT